MTGVVLRPALQTDLAAIQRALYLAASWRGDNPEWPFDRVINHAYFRQFWVEWGCRPHDLGVIAETTGSFAGAAFGRLFSTDAHAHGFVDESTPEVAIGVEQDHRRRGIGHRLLDALATHARRDGLPGLSLSVELDNPARSLYERCGFVEIHRDADAARMLMRFEPPFPESVGP